MAAAPIFAAVVKSDYAQVTAANTNRDGSGATVLLTSGAAGGSRIDRIKVRATGTTTNGVVRLYLSLDAGVTKRLLEEIMITAAVASTTIQVSSYDLGFSGGLLLKNANAQIYASTHNNETFNLFAEGGDF